MFPLLARRLLVYLLAIALPLGLLGHAIQAAHADVAGAAMVMVPDASMSSKGGCEGCCDDQNVLSPAVCSAYCAGIVAIPVGFVEFGAAPVDAYGDGASRTATSHTIPPDPPPPRAAILS